jgi:hypothetical protein
MLRVRDMLSLLATTGQPVLDAANKVLAWLQPTNSK